MSERLQSSPVISEEKESSSVRLTQYSHGSGCGCKIAPSVLEEILRDEEGFQSFKNLLVGNEGNDDAAVYELDNEQCLISTVDFFMPIVDDAFDFGRIAATNSISDVYAMGGTPLLAIAVLGWPVDKLAPSIARQVLAGARSVCKEVNIPIAGGHSIDSPEPIFGLSVNGLVKKNHLKRNNTAQAGDFLFLTKPIGTGIIASAQKKGKAKEKDVATAIKVMTQLNRIGEKLGSLEYIHSMTDVTGFGLLGHLIEMMEASGCSATLEYKSVPLIEGIEEYTNQFIFPDNVYRNWNSYERKVIGVNGPSFTTLCDPQTSGGLLVAVAPDYADDFILLMKENGISSAFKPLGRVTDKKDFVVEVIE
jgi:selenide,water dikinase